MFWQKPCRARSMVLRNYEFVVRGYAAIPKRYRPPINFCQALTNSFVTSELTSVNGICTKPLTRRTLPRARMRVHWRFQPRKRLRDNRSYVTMRSSLGEAFMRFFNNHADRIPGKPKSIGGSTTLLQRRQCKPHSAGHRSPTLEGRDELPIESGVYHFGRDCLCIRGN